MHSSSHVHSHGHVAMACRQQKWRYRIFERKNCRRKVRLGGFTLEILQGLLVVLQYKVKFTTSIAGGGGGGG